MAPNVINLTLDDMVALAAYAAPVWRGLLYRPLAKIVVSSCGGTISS
jgi:hypothetical protein